jgi:NRAMP (natural resistance-associated macrophage protein)-like metal ion transporter
MFTAKLKKLKKATTKLFHGIITGGADNDPAGITTYSVVGATTGLTQLFLVPLSTVFLIVIQAICARIGDVKKKGLALVIKEGFGRKTALVTALFLILANLTTMGADLSAIGMSFSLLLPKISTLFILPLVSLFIWYVVVFKNYRFISKFLIFLSLVFVSYIFSGFAAKPDWSQILTNTFIPKISLESRYWLMAVALLGTTITPYLFFWQVSEEVEDKPSIKDVKNEVRENAPGFIFSNLITYFIIICTASVLFANKITITNANEAAMALKPFLGDKASFLFALGIIGAGLLALPVLSCSTAYAVAEIFNWREGLSRKPSSARGFYTVLSATFFIALAISLLKINPIKILFYSQVFSGLLAPFLLILIMIIAGSEKMMGKYKIGWGTNFLGWLTVLIMLIAGVAIFTT